MQAQTWRTRPVRSARAVPGKHAKSRWRADSPRKTAHRILIAALLVGSLAAGSAAASEYASATSPVSTHHQMAARSAMKVNWMY